MTFEDYLDSLPATQPERIKAHINNYYTCPKGTLAEGLLFALGEAPNSQPRLDSIEDLIRADFEGDTYDR